MNLLRSFQNEELNPARLPFQSFQEILQKLSGNTNTFLKYYDGDKLKEILTFDEFYQRVTKLSETLPKNKTIAVVHENSPEALISYSAVMNIGSTLIPLDPFQSKEFYQKVADQFHCDFVIASSGHAAENAFAGEKKSTLQGKVIFTSSGTTGRPKGIVQSFPSLLANTIATIKVHQLTSESIHFCILPVFHVNAFSFSFFTSLMNMNEVILNKNFSQLHFWKVVNETKPNIVSAIPPVLRVLTEDPRNATVPDSLKYFTSAASFLGKTTLLEFYDKFKLPVIQAYGLSETVNFTATFPTNLAPETYRSIILADEKTTIGPEVWGNNVFLLDENNEVIQDEKHEGELCVRGWNVMDEYFEATEESASAFRNDYFHSGDLAYFRTFNGQRFYYITGRKKEIAKINGRLVYLNEIDELALKLHYVSSACCVGYLDKNGEEQLGLYLILKEEKAVREIKSDIKKILPMNVSISSIITGNEIKMTASGKKRRKEMADLYFGEKK